MLSHIRAATVIKLAGDRVVVVAVDRRDAALLDQPAHLVRVGAVANEIAAAVDGVDPDHVDRVKARVERGQVAVDVGDDRYAIQVVLLDGTADLHDDTASL